MRKSLGIIALCLASPAIAEPISGWLTGVEDDFLQFICEPLNDGRKECTFTQVTMRPKQKKSEIEAAVSEQLPETLSELAAASSDEELGEICGYTRTMLSIIENLKEGDRETAAAKLTELPERMRDEFDFDEAAEKISQSDPRELEDILTQTAMVNRLCDKPDAETAEEFIRWRLEKNSRTCELYLNSWTDTFKQVSGKVWALEDSSAKGVCAVSRLDRFECEGPYSCVYVAEKRILNKEGEGIIPCGELEENAFRYEHGKEIYTSCSIMSWF